MWAILAAAEKAAADNRQWPAEAAAAMALNEWMQATLLAKTLLEQQQKNAPFCH